jgi:hypothetical protein
VLELIRWEDDVGSISLGVDNQATISCQLTGQSQDITLLIRSTEHMMAYRQSMQGSISLSTGSQGIKVFQVVSRLTKQQRKQQRATHPLHSQHSCRKLYQQASQPSSGPSQSTSKRQSIRAFHDSPHFCILHSPTDPYRLLRTPEESVRNLIVFLIKLIIRLCQDSS